MPPDDQHWSRVRELFDRAVELAPERRGQLLASEPPEVRSEVERLLELDTQASALLEQRGDDAVEALWGATLVAGQEVGPYRLIRAIGSGGMGVVFEAEEDSPRRRVALKTVRAEFFTPELLRRFENEVQLLARLEHPGIARVYAAGSFERAGVDCPYYTMELVEDARTLLEHANGEQLSRRARLELFLQACDAVEHGHRKGVIHRDLKPGNLLVDGRGRLKVIDFGLARPDDPAALGTASMHTRAGLVLGTLAYMSPEHVSGRPFEIDTQSDVYSLGCILCELLTGGPPLELFDVPVRTALERIERGDPELPPELPRELAWIVGCTTARDRSRRYGSAGDLAADVRRFLRHEPVLAAPPSRSYALLAFARRHRGPLAAALAVVIALAVGLARASLAREHAELEADLAEQVSRFLEGVFLQGNVFELGPEASIREAIARAATRLDEIERADVRAIVIGLVGQGFLNLGEVARAEELVAQAVRLGEEHLGPRSAHRLRNEILWVELLERTGRYEEARDLCRHLIPLAADVLETRDVLSARYNLAICESRLGRHAEAEEIYRAMLDEQRAAGGGTDVIVNLSHRVGVELRLQGRFDEAREVYTEALETSRAIPGLEAYAVTLLSEIGELESAVGNMEEAERILREVEEEFDAGGQSANNRLMVALDLAEVLLERGELEESWARIERANELAAEIPGESRLEVRCLLVEARHAAVADDVPGGIELAEEALALALRIAGPGATSTAASFDVLIDLHDELGDSTALDGVLTRAYDTACAAHGPDHPMPRGFLARREALLEDSDE